MTQIESKVVPNVLSTNTPSISVKPFSCPCISSEKKEKWNQKTAQQQQPTNKPRGRLWRIISQLPCHSLVEVHLPSLLLLSSSSRIHCLHYLTCLFNTSMWKVYPKRTLAFYNCQSENTESNSNTLYWCYYASGQTLNVYHNCKDYLIKNGEKAEKTDVVKTLKNLRIKLVHFCSMYEVHFPEIWL